MFYHAGIVSTSDILVLLLCKSDYGQLNNYEKLVQGRLGDLALGLNFATLMNTLLVTSG